jgi:hypothetical protein
MTCRTRGSGEGEAGDEKLEAGSGIALTPRLLPLASRFHLLRESR